MRFLLVIFTVFAGVFSFILPLNEQPPVLNNNNLALNEQPPVPVAPSGALPPSPHTWNTKVDYPCSDKEAEWLAYLKNVDGYKDYGVTVRYENGEPPRYLTAEELALA